jgi:MFS-type transporter involved in bile tolerance (Atg22 family)
MASWASYQIAFLAEVVPTPKAYLFFALFNTIGRTSGFVGPFVASAIIEAADGNTNMAFIFLVCMGSIGLLFLWFVDPAKAKLDNARCESSLEIWGIALIFRYGARSK